MARFKPYDYGQMKLLPVSFQEQILPGSFEHTLNHLIDHEIDLKVFEHHYRNDETGAPAYDPAILLKVNPAMRQQNRTRPGKLAGRSALGRERTAPPRRATRKRPVVSFSIGVFLQTR